MKIIKKIIGWNYTESSIPHSGWLPENSTKPQDIEAKEKIVDVQIVDYGDEEILLIWKFKDEIEEHDIWCGTTKRAEKLADEMFDIKDGDWILG